MKNFLIALALLGSFTIGSAYAVSTVTIINHYDKDLIITKYSQGSRNLPNFQNSFTLGQGQQASSSVLYSKDFCQNGHDGNPSAFVSIAAGSNDTDPNAFFGVGLACNDRSEVVVSGLKTYGMSFSWVNGENATVTVCKIDDFSNGKCR